MKNITEYVSESMLITEFLGFGKSKQIDFAKQLCGGIRGISLVWNNALKKLLPGYISDGSGSHSLFAAYVKADEIIYCQNKVSSDEYNLGDSQNLRIIIMLDSKHQYEVQFEGYTDENGDEQKLDKDEKHKTLVRVINKFVKGGYSGSSILDDLWKPLNEYAEENGCGPKAKKIYNMFSTLLDAIVKKPESILDFGTEKGIANTEYVDKILGKLMKQ